MQTLCKVEALGNVDAGIGDNLVDLGAVHRGIDGLEHLVKLVGINQAAAVRIGAEKLRLGLEDSEQRNLRKHLGHVDQVEAGVVLKLRQRGCGRGGALRIASRLLNQVALRRPCSLGGVACNIRLAPRRLLCWIGTKQARERREIQKRLERVLARNCALGVERSKQGTSWGGQGKEVNAKPTSCSSRARARASRSAHLARASLAALFFLSTGAWPDLWVFCLMGRPLAAPAFFFFLWLRRCEAACC